MHYFRAAIYDIIVTNERKYTVIAFRTHLDSIIKFEIRIEN